jgi:hypothetical protein
MVLSSRFAEDFAGFKDPAGEPETSFRRGWIPARMVVDQDERISAEGDYWFKNSGLKSGLAAVDWNRCSANERSLVGCDKKDGFGDSSGRPTRLSGTPEAKLVFCSFDPAKRASISVSIGPGATTFTRMPNGAPSRAA